MRKPRVLNNAFCLLTFIGMNTSSATVCDCECSIFNFIRRSSNSGVFVGVVFFFCEKQYFTDTKATRSLKNYSCCPNPYVDITFTIFIRRRTIYYIVNLIFPSVTLAAMTMLGFTLPSDCGEKMTLGTWEHAHTFCNTHTHTHWAIAHEVRKCHTEKIN